MAHSRRPKDHHAEPQATKSDWQALSESVRDHPWAYLAGVAFVGLVILTVALYRQVAERQERAQNSQLAGALDQEEQPLELDALRRIAESSDATDESVYMFGESAFDAQKYDDARKAFERVRNEFPQSQYVPTAVEGLADIAMEQGDYEAAAKLYQEIRDRWPTSFAARRQLLNLGRVYEKMDKLNEAIAAYREQTTAFAESTVAAESQQALDRLKAAHPELFPEEAMPAAKEAAELPVAPTTEVPVAPAPETAAPAEEAPAEPAPETAAPVELAPAGQPPAAESPTVSEPTPADEASPEPAAEPAPIDGATATESADEASTAQ